MSTTPRHDPAHTDGSDPRLDAYIDGLMTEAERTEFERDVGGQPGIQREIELQSRIDAGLRELFAYDPSAAQRLAAPDALGRIGPETVDSPEREARTGWLTRPQSRRLAVAAGILLALGAVFIYTNRMLTPPEKFITPEFVYQTVEKPEFICTTDDEFAAAIEKRFGEPLVLAAAPSDQIVAEGWAYGDGNTYDGKIISASTLVLITRVKGEKVLVLMDRAKDDRTLETPSDPSLHVFRRQTGGVVLYELTHADKPAVLDRLVPPKKP
ncbi:MAG: hypothetical protein IT438_09795 [Phycisphaerales bacterium]|nr:hypothetical protein [Phycisphaerales bacterium]